MTAVARMYGAPFEDISVTNDSDQDLWELTAGSNRKVIVHGFGLTSAQGITAAELARLRLVRRTTAGTGGSAVTEVKLDPDNDISPEAALVQLVTTPGTPGDVLPACWQWSQQGELLYLPPPEMRIIVPKTARIGLNLLSALGGTRKMSGWVIWEEI